MYGNNRNYVIIFVGMDKNLVFLIRNVSSEKFGGGEIYQLNLAKELRKAGYEPVILTNSRKLLENAEKIGIKTLRPPHIKRQNWSGVRNLLLPIYFLRIWRMQKWYEKIMADNGIAAVNVQSRDEWIAATRAAKKFEIKVLWTDHADLRNWVLWNVNSKFKNVIGKMVLDDAKNAKRVIFVGKNIKNETDRIIYPRKIDNAMVIRNGVFDEKKKFAKVKVEKESFVFIGRVTEEKGVNELVEAFCMVRKGFPGAVLNIYGEVDMHSRFGAAEDGVVFHGQTDNPLKALAENEIFVLPSYREGLSLSLLDATMMGKKIIASDIDGNSEVVVDGKTGILVPVRNVDKLARAMIWMLKNKEEANELARNARDYYAENFDFEKIFAKKMLPLYNSGKEEKQ